jgi:DNA-binding MarR family transcriptional regulator
MSNLTAKELEVLTAIDNDCYGDNILDAVWTWSVADELDMPAASFPGVVASLSKKGLVESYHDRHAIAEDESTLSITEAGFHAYVAEVGRENMRKWYDESDLAKYNK